MRFLVALRLGLRRAARHPWLALAVYLFSLAPPLFLLWLASPLFAGPLDHSPFAEGLLSGRAFAVWSDLWTSSHSTLAPLAARLGPLLVLAALLQVPLAAGAVEVLLERQPSGRDAFFLGVGRHLGRFLRSALWFAAGLLVIAIAAGAVTWLGSSRAAASGDSRQQLAGWAGAAILALLLLAPLALAYDLSRLAAASHGQGSTLRGLLRALRFVLLRPALFLPLFLSFALLVAGLHLAYAALTLPWNDTTAGQVALLFLVQQTLMLLRAFLKLTVWSAELTCYQALGDPPFCAPRRRKAK